MGEAGFQFKTSTICCDEFQARRKTIWNYQSYKSWNFPKLQVDDLRHFLQLLNLSVPVIYQHSTSPYITHKNKTYSNEKMWIDQQKENYWILKVKFS